jgi:hypothetical protein
VGSRAGLDGYGKSRLYWGSIPRTVQPVAGRYAGPHTTPCIINIIIIIIIRHYLYVGYLQLRTRVFGVHNVAATL